MNLYQRFRLLPWAVCRGINYTSKNHATHATTGASEIISSQPVLRRKPKSTSSKVAAIVDFRTVQVHGGKGGDGCVSLLRLCKNPLGGPDGGDGGNGGHVAFKATSGKNSLEHLASVIKAQDGVKGSNRDCHGKNADHLVVEVPIGTLFKKCGSMKIVADLDVEGAVFIAARGGAGGKGNHYFVSDVNQAPEIAEYGADGESFRYDVEMRTIAHVGLVGLPNAGKSSFLRAVSRARPKVAPYPFTTLQPHVGVVEYDDLEQIKVADIPGLIAGAHKNRGLGVEFLRHIERCICLLYVIDTSCTTARQQLALLRYELEQYNGDLLSRPSAVVANKMDVPLAAANLESLKRYAESLDLPVYPISALSGQGTAGVLQHIRKLYNETRQTEDRDFLV